MDGFLPHPSRKPNPYFLPSASSHAAQVRHHQILVQGEVLHEPRLERNPPRKPEVLCGTFDDESGLATKMIRLPKSVPVSCQRATSRPPADKLVPTLGLHAANDVPHGRQTIRPDDERPHCGTPTHVPHARRPESNTDAKGPATTVPHQTGCRKHPRHFSRAVPSPPRTACPSRSREQTMHVRQTSRVVVGRRDFQTAGAIRMLAISGCFLSTRDVLPGVGTGFPSPSDNHSAARNRRDSLRQLVRGRCPRNCTGYGYEPGRILLL